MEPFCYCVESLLLHWPPVTLPTLVCSQIGNWECLVLLSILHASIYVQTFILIQASVFLAAWLHTVYLAQVSVQCMTGSLAESVNKHIVARVDNLVHSQHTARDEKWMDGHQEMKLSGNQVSNWLLVITEISCADEEEQVKTVQPVWGRQSGRGHVINKRCTCVSVGLVPVLAGAGQSDQGSPSPMSTEGVCFLLITSLRLLFHYNFTLWGPELSFSLAKIDGSAHSMCHTPTEVCWRSLRLIIMTHAAVHVTSFIHFQLQDDSSVSLFQQFVKLDPYCSGLVQQGGTAGRRPP